MEISSVADGNYGWEENAFFTPSKVTRFCTDSARIGHIWVADLATLSRGHEYAVNKISSEMFALLDFLKKKDSVNGTSYWH